MTSARLTLDVSEILQITEDNSLLELKSCTKWRGFTKYFSFQVDAINRVYRELIGEAEVYFAWVADRIGIVDGAKYELDWGRLVLMLASLGGIDLLENESGIKEIELLESDRMLALSLRQRFCQLSRDCARDLQQEWGEQFNVSIIKRLQFIADHLSMLDEIHDLMVFLEERDIIECTLLGAEQRELFELPKSETGKLQSLDDQIRKYVQDVAVVRIGQEYSTEVVNSLAIDWLPENFWWRHLV